MVPTCRPPFAATLVAAILAANPTSLPGQADGPGPEAPAREASPTVEGLGTLRWRGIGPANPRGRIAAVEALDSDWRSVLLASASGGVFLSRNGGHTWEAIFDTYGAGSIGAAAWCRADPDVLWIGTGEAANRNSSGWGDGLYKSEDGGGSFRRVGLEDTHHIAEIAPHPTDPDVCWVAAVGHLWGGSGDRGLFVTRDGGASWSKVAGGLPDVAGVGCTEITLHPDDPDTLYAGMYYRRRGPASMQSGGPGGGLYRSEDGGTTWEKLTRGLPEGDTGMIDVAIHRADPAVVVANVEASDDLPDDLSVPGPGVYRSDDGGDTWTYLLRHTTRPFYHGQIEIDPLDPDRIYVVSRDFRVSDDGGKTWRGKWWGGGGDDHDMWICPTDPRIFYLATDQGGLLTLDGGRATLAFDNLAIGQYYAVGLDMRDPYWVIGGLQDCGLWITPSNSREPRGILNDHSTWIGEGDGFYAAVDPRDGRTAYLVNHVGFCARLDLESRAHAYITPTPETVVNYDEHFDPTRDDPEIRYTIDPGEHWFFGERPNRPQLPPQFRFNWCSPLRLDPHDPDVVWFAGNHLFRSPDQGRSWRIVSPDLTTDDPALRDPNDQGGLVLEVTGGENHCTVVTIGPSPVDPMVVWCGTDDGNVQFTRDGGTSWTNVRPALQTTPGAPRPGAWISRTEASPHDAGTCFVALDDHRRDDMRPYVFVTRDFGASWRDVTGNLPGNGSVYVVRQDPVNPDVVYCGTEFGAFVSVTGGGTWQPLGDGLPTVAVHDLRIHPRDHDVVAGTHGRSIWILDDVTPLQQWSEDVARADLHLFAPRRATHWQSIKLGRRQPSMIFRGENPPPGAAIRFRASEAMAGERLEVRIESPHAGGHDWRQRLTARPGLQEVRWPMQFAPTEEELLAARARLQTAVATLRERIPADRLPAFEKDLRLRRPTARGPYEKPTALSLDALRSRLVRNWGKFAGGTALFGPPIGRVRAEPGVYRVTLRLADDPDAPVRAATLEVRDDPILTKR